MYVTFRLWKHSILRGNAFWSVQLIEFCCWRKGCWDLNMSIWSACILTFDIVIYLDDKRFWTQYVHTNLGLSPVRLFSVRPIGLSRSIFEFSSAMSNYIWRTSSNDHFTIGLVPAGPAHLKVILQSSKSWNYLLHLKGSLWYYELARSLRMHCGSFSIGRLTY